MPELVETATGLIHFDFGEKKTVRKKMFEF